MAEMVWPEGQVSVSTPGVGYGIHSGSVPQMLEPVVPPEVPAVVALEALVPFPLLALACEPVDPIPLVAPEAEPDVDAATLPAELPTPLALVLLELALDVGEQAARVVRSGATAAARTRRRAVEVCIAPG